MNRSFRAPERGKMGNMRLNDNRDEDLALFREMRKREKERDDLLLQSSDEFDAPLGSRTGSSPIFNISSARQAPALAPLHKSSADDFLNADNDKNDYEWLLTPPGTPLFPSLEMESQRTVMSQLGTPKARPASLKSRLANPTPETGRSNPTSRQPTSSAGLNTSTSGLRRPSSSGGSGSRPSTPTGRPTLSSTSRSSSSPAPNRPAVTVGSKITLTASKATSAAASKPLRSSTPTARHTLPSEKVTVPPRSSTPAPRSSARSSTPTNRPSLPAPKSIARSATPTRRPAAACTPAVSIKSPTTSVGKSLSGTVKNAVLPRSNSPTVKPRPWKPSDMPGFSLDAPPNLRTSLPERPLSATRGRPGAPNSRAPLVEPFSNGRIRRQSCSPSRRRPPNCLVHSSGSSVPVPAVNRLHVKANDNMCPVLIGSKMVERVVNMRKLAPPKQDEKHSPYSNLSAKSSSPDSSGFGRTLSKKSLDMAMRHMDIRRTIAGNLLPLMANIPASSLFSVRSGSNRSRTVSVSDSPIATSSNASSEVSVNNNALCMDTETYDEVSSSKPIRSPSSLRGR